MTGRETNDGFPKSFRECALTYRISLDTKFISHGSEKGKQEVRTRQRMGWEWAVSEWNGSSVNTRYAVDICILACSPAWIQALIEDKYLENEYLILHSLLYR